MKEQAIKDMYKIYRIAAEDYSGYPNPLKELFEYRKEICKFILNNNDIQIAGEMLEYCEDKIKTYLSL